MFGESNVNSLLVLMTHADEPIILVLRKRKEDEKKTIAASMISLFEIMERLFFLE